MKSKLNLELIKNYPKQKGITVKQFCNDCGISYSTYKNIISAKINIGLCVLQGLAKGLKEDKINLFIE